MFVGWYEQICGRNLRGSHPTIISTFFSLEGARVEMILWNKDMAQTQDKNHNGTQTKYLNKMETTTNWAKRVAFKRHCRKKTFFFSLHICKWVHQWNGAPTLIRSAFNFIHEFSCSHSCEQIFSVYAYKVVDKVECVLEPNGKVKKAAVAWKQHMFAHMRMALV